jgi:hypothetical protein
VHGQHGHEEDEPAAGDGLHGSVEAADGEERSGLSATAFSLLRCRCSTCWVSLGIPGLRWFVRFPQPSPLTVVLIGLVWFRLITPS